MLPLHQPHFHTLPHDLLKQLLEQFRSLKASVPVLREGGVMRNLLIETQTGKPAPRQMHAQLFHQLALAGNAVQIANQQNAQQEFGIDRRSPGFAVAVLEPLANKSQADVLVDEPQQVVFGDVLFQFEIVEQRFGTGTLSHHDQQSSEDQNHVVHGRNTSLYRTSSANQSDFFNTHACSHLQSPQSNPD